jgi:hypothetical protein
MLSFWRVQIAIPAQLPVAREGKKERRSAKVAASQKPFATTSDLLSAMVASMT